MNPRLAQLHHQKALLEEHLSWLEEEIARAAEPDPGPTSRFEIPPAQGPVSPVFKKFQKAAQLTRNAPLAADPEPVHETEREEYFQANPAESAQETRKGCLLLAGFALLGMAGLVGAVYLIY